MRDRLEVALTIDDTLRWFLFGLECSLGSNFNPVEIHRVFADRTNDQVSAKTYCFHNGHRTRVLGVVDEYEPETIAVSVESTSAMKETIDDIHSRARINALQPRIYEADFIAEIRQRVREMDEGSVPVHTHDEVMLHIRKLLQ